MPKKKPAKRKPPRKPSNPKSPIPNPQSPTPNLDHIPEPLRGMVRPIAELVPDPRNARRHSEENIGAIVASFREFGFRGLVTVQRGTNMIEAGHGRVEAAKRLGWTHVPVLDCDDDDARARAAALADNVTATLAEWDDALLQEQIAAMIEQTPDLADDLLLADLVAETAAEEEDKPAGSTEIEPESWQVVVDCGDEETQQKVFEEMKAKEYSCRLLTL